MRIPAPKAVEAEVLIRSKRRCCLCFFVEGVEDSRRGQIAHLNRNAADSHFENLVFLCLEHHDQYDSKSSQSKGYVQEEVRRYRDRLYISFGSAPSMEQIDRVNSSMELETLADTFEYDSVRRTSPDELACISRPWRLPLWMIANQSEMFAYKAQFDGVCLIERIDLPNARIVIACIEIVGNPGQSITNAVELLCFQVCERLSIPPKRLIWLEHYDEYKDAEWHQVNFASFPPRGPFKSPKWTLMTDDMWKNLRLKPKSRLSMEYGRYGSKLRKLFHWPDGPIP